MIFWKMGSGYDKCGVGPMQFPISPRGSHSDGQMAGDSSRPPCEKGYLQGRWAVLWVWYSPTTCVYQPAAAEHQSFTTEDEQNFI